MSKIVLLDSRLFISGADLSGVGNKIELVEEDETRTTTNFRSGGAREVVSGIGSTSLEAEGQWEAGTAGSVDDSFWANRRVLEPWSVAAEGDSDLAAGGIMYLTRGLRTKSQLGGSVGEVAPWSYSGVGSWPLARGVAAHPSGTPRTANGSGTSLNLGAVPEGKFLYANLHVVSIAGTSTPSITVTVQSDSATGFPTPTDAGVFAARTTVGGEAIRIPGPITDTWWRVSWAVTGSGPSFLFLVSMGIE